jgi:hypothetical protein
MISAWENLNAKECGNARNAKESKGVRGKEAAVAASFGGI